MSKIWGFERLGGQPSDRGKLNEVEVERVEKTPQGLLHVLSAPIDKGTALLSLDWLRRYDHMQQHTAQHLLTRCAIDSMGWMTRSFHIGPVVSDIELDCAPPSAQHLEALEDSVAKIVADARPIRAFRVSPEEYEALAVRSRGLPAGHEGEIRLVDIERFDLNTCGGTHLASTSEVETLKIISSEPLRGGCRLHWVAGKRVRQRLAMQDQRLTDLRTILDTGDDQIVDGVRLKMEQLQQARSEARALLKRLAGARTDELVRGAEKLVDIHLEGVESALLRPIADLWSSHPTDKVALLTAEDEKGALFVLVQGQGSRLDLQSAGSTLSEQLEGRGGGSGGVFQGRTGSLGNRSQAVAQLRNTIG
jgi:alanyl-tRNA synthetase